MKKFVYGLALLGATSLFADYQLTLIDKDGVETNQCIKSYSFSNNLESLAREKGVLKDVYSIEETMTNKIYLGKPVYRKVFLFDNFIVESSSIGVSKYTNIISNDIDEIVDFNFSGLINNEILISQNSSQHYNQDNNKYSFTSDYRKSINKIGIYLNNNTITDKTSWKISNLKVIVEYTKTTDSASSPSNTFKSYLHYVPSSSTTNDVTTIDLENTGVRFLEGYTYDSTTDSCTKN